MPLAVETPANKPITIDLTPQATDPDGDTLYFACCDPQRRRHHRSPTTPGELTRRSTPTTTSPAPATFSYTVDDQQGHTVAGAVTIDVLPPTNRPPTASRRYAVEVEAGVADEHRPRRARHRPRPRRHADVHVDRAGQGRRDARRHSSAAGDRRRSTRAEQTDSFQYTVTDPPAQSATAR